jgi:hypothetical protein
MIPKPTARSVTPLHLLRRNKSRKPGIRRKTQLDLRRKTLPSDCQAQDISK